MAFLSRPLTIRPPAVLYLPNVEIRNYEFGLSSNGLTSAQNCAANLLFDPSVKKGDTQAHDPIWNL
jgi:hypothetical protein